MKYIASHYSLDTPVAQLRADFPSLSDWDDEEFALALSNSRIFRDEENSPAEPERKEATPDEETPASTAPSDCKDGVPPSVPPDASEAPSDTETAAPVVFAGIGLNPGSSPAPRPG